MLRKENIADIYPLSPMQEGMLFHSIYDPDSLSYFFQISYDHRGELDVPLMDASLNELFRRHDILR
ncbi:MAG: hypothetical protein ICV83_12045, partial [Cytophagales bacterium]|nr:hypothetical protein [Cytophagales bacterium]